MSMFDMMKQAKEMYSKAKEMKKSLESKRIEVEYEGVKIVANGKQEIISINLDESLVSQGKEKIEKALMKACNQVAERTRKIMEEEAKKMTGGMPPGDMMNMLK